MRQKKKSGGGICAVAIGWLVSFSFLFLLEGTAALLCCFRTAEIKRHRFPFGRSRSAVLCCSNKGWIDSYHRLLYCCYYYFLLWLWLCLPSRIIIPQRSGTKKGRRRPVVGAETIEHSPTRFLEGGSILLCQFCQFCQFCPFCNSWCSALRTKFAHRNKGVAHASGRMNSHATRGAAHPSRNEARWRRPVFKSGVLVLLT